MAEAAVPVEAELGVLSLIAHSPAVHDQIFLSLRPDDFYSSRHRAFFGAAAELWKAHKAADPITVFHAMQAAGDAEAANLVSEWETWFGSEKSVQSYIDLIVSAGERRRILAVCNQVVAEYDDRMTSTDSLIETMQSTARAYFERRTKHAVRPLADALNATIDSIEMSDGDIQPRFRSGFADLDSVAEIVPGLNVIAGRPSMGKSTLALNIAENLARNGTRILLVALESTDGDLGQSFIAARSRIQRTDIRRGVLSDTQRAKITLACSELSQLPISLYSSDRLDEICAQARMMARRHRDFCLVVDYLQLVRTSMQHRESKREQEVSHISREFKLLGTSMNFPVIALAQLNRAVEQRGNDRRPRLSDLRESGAIEQDADLVMMLYREDYYDEGKNPGEVEVIVCKQRNGPTGTVKLSFLRRESRFASLSSRADSGPKDWTAAYDA